LAGKERGIEGKRASPVNKRRCQMRGKVPRLKIELKNLMTNLAPDGLFWADNPEGSVNDRKTST